jgi:hypothetical protein
MKMVRAIDLAPATVDGLGECLAVAARSARVWIEDVEPFVGEREHLQPGGRPMRGARATMDLDDDRPGPQRVLSLDQLSVEGMSFRMDQSVTNGIATVWLEPVRAIARQLAHGPILDGINVCRLSPIAGDHRDLIATYDNRVASDLAGNQG